MARDRKSSGRKSARQEVVPAVPERGREVAPASLQGQVVEASLASPFMAVPGVRPGALRRHGPRAAVGVALLVLLAPVISWAWYQSRFVTSSNATVRAHLAEIGTRIQGRISSVDVEEGERVKAGQVLVRFEDGHLLAEVEEARAALTGLEQAREVELLSIGQAGQEALQQQQEAQAKVSAAEAQKSAAQIRATEAQRVVEVQESLRASGGAISGEVVRNSEATRRAAEAMAQEASANHAASRSVSDKARLNTESLAIRKRQISVLEADIQQSRARLQRANAQLESAYIRAPDEGAIVRRFVEPGGSVDVGQPIISMWLGRDIWVEAWIDENDIGSVRAGNPATLTLQAFPDREFEGVVQNVGLVTDFDLPETEVPQPRHLRMRGAPVVGVRIKLVDPPQELLPGLSADVAIRKTGK